MIEKEAIQAIKFFINSCIGTTLLCTVIEYFDRKYNKNYPYLFNNSNKIFS